jgi:hypothetical protein
MTFNRNTLETLAIAAFALVVAVFGIAVHFA